MSELENVARHIVRHEEERQVEKIKLESEIKALEEVLEHGISTEFVEEEVIYIYSPKTAHDMREKLEENYKQLHAQLTIPQSIADLLDKFIKIDFDDVGHEDWWIQENGLIEWFSKTPNCYIKDAYLAGKALGVDLVKVI
ncbi:hypothetical protein [Lactococcus lactis]|uniref:hypothetical protein n=1 Tax=Lactococcus lactis TaxID=1358 RepID=UPI0022E12F51|nr:hypothetical protein [Lactococcus lactis]